MTLNDVFNVCRERGVQLVITGNELRAQGRKGAVNDALRNGLAKHKQAIIDAAADGISLDELRIRVDAPSLDRFGLGAYSADANGGQKSMTRIFIDKLDGEKWRSQRFFGASLAERNLERRRSGEKGSQVWFGIGLNDGTSH